MELQCSHAMIRLRLEIRVMSLTISGVDQWTWRLLKPIV